MLCCPRSFSVTCRPSPPPKILSLPRLAATGMLHKAKSSAQLLPAARLKFPLLKLEVPRKSLGQEGRKGKGSFPSWPCSDHRVVLEVPARPAAHIRGSQEILNRAESRGFIAAHHWK